MNAATLDAMTPLQHPIVERALTPAKELETTAGTAPAGQVIDRCETLLLGNGREFPRHALQAQVDEPEKKTRPAGSAPVG